MRTDERPCVRGCEFPESTPDDPRPRPAKHGHLCNRCYYSTERAIAELPSQHHDLAERLQPGSSGQGPYVTGTSSHPLPIDPRVAEHRARIVDLLTSWARMVAEERGEVGALSPHPTVTATYLGSRLDWCAEQPWCDDLVREMGELRGRAFSLLFPSGRKRVEIGECAENGCKGQLITVMGDQDDLLPAEIWCEACGRTVPAVQWRALRKRLTGVDHDPILTVAQASKLYGVPPRTLARWVADGRLTNIAEESGSSVALVHGAEVEEIMHTMGVLRDSA